MTGTNSVGGVERLLAQREACRLETEKSGHPAVRFRARRLKIAFDAVSSEGKFYG